jgi:D-alanyl-D-alanine carboxypeptidase
MYQAVRAFGLFVFAAVSACSPRGLAIDAVIGTAGEMAVDEGVAGMVIGVEQRGVRRVRAFGRARIAPDIPSRADETFEIGSITKQFTAALVLQLVDEGKLRLDATVGELLPTAPPAARSVTVAQLLSHTGGIPNYLDVADAADRVESAGSATELLAVVHDLPLRFAPGRRWEYSNSGYLLVGDIVERLAGLPWAELVTTRLTQPLGLTATRSCGPPDEDARRPFAYDYAGTRRPPFGGYFPAADRSLCSTADDLLTWANALGRGRMISTASYQRMITPTRVDSGGTADYGLGLHVVARDGRRVLFHNGLINSFRSVVERWPDDDLSFVVCENTPSNMADYVAMQVGDVLVHGPDRLFALRFCWVHRYAATAVLLGIIAVLAWRRRSARRRRTPPRLSRIP